MSEETKGEITPETQARTLKNGERVICDCDGKLATVMGCLQSTRDVVIVAITGKSEELFIGGNTPDSSIDITWSGGQKILRAQKICAMEGLRNTTTENSSFK